MTLGIVTACWKRPAVTAAVMQYYASIVTSGLFLVRVAAVSPGGDTPRVEGWDYVEHANSPLSDKWNAAMQRMKEHNPDAVMVVGSDDLASAGYIHAACAVLSDRVGIVLFEELCCIEVSTGRALFMRPPRLGAGRLLSRAMLERLGWQPWPTGLERRLDGGMDTRMKSLRRVRPRLRSVTLRAAPGRLIVDLKTEENMWSFGEMARYGYRSADGAALMQEHFPAQAGLLN